MTEKTLLIDNPFSLDTNAKKVMDDLIFSILTYWFKAGSKVGRTSGKSIY